MSESWRDSYDSWKLMGPDDETDIEADEDDEDAA